MRWNLLQELPMRTILPHPLPCVCWIACPGCECRALSDGVWNPKDTPVAVKPVGSGQALYTGASWREDAAAVKKARRFGHPRQDVVGAGRWRMGKLRGWGTSSTTGLPSMAKTLFMESFYPCGWVESTRLSTRPLARCTWAAQALRSTVSLRASSACKMASCSGSV